MPTSSLYRIKKDDIPQAVACLKDTFKGDPLWIEVFRDACRKWHAASITFKSGGK